MPDVEPVAAYSYVVHLAQAVGEPVADARIEMHRALAATIAGNAAAAVDPPRETKYLTFESLSTDPAQITALLAPATERPLDALIIVDVAAAPYDLLGERFLFYLARAVATLVEESARTVLMLLDRIPSTDTSLLWHALSGISTQGRVIVAGGDRRVRVFGTTLEGSVDALKQEIRRQGDKLTGPLDERFARKILPRLGHFKGADRAGEPTCSRFYYDCALAEAELTELLDRWVRRRLRKKADRAEATFVLCGIESPWMINAAMVVIGRHGATAVELPPRPKARDVKQLKRGRTNVLLFDVVSTGATLDATVRALVKGAVSIQAAAFTALATSKELLTSGPVTVDTMHIVPREVTSRASCSQCHAGLPYTAPDQGEPHLRISSFDLWTVLTSVDWGQEVYGPEGVPKYEYLPDFKQVFRDYGNWIAFRYGMLLEHLGQTSDVVVVCPAEPAVQQLVDKLRLRFEDRLVAVAVSRELINQLADKRMKARDVESETTKNPTEDWEFQLLDLRASQRSVVVLDEFAASGGTARAMVDLLKAFRIQVSAYLPFVDFNTALDFGGGIRIHPLYELPSPRPS